MPLQIPHQSYIAWKICITILHCIAISMSAFRVWLRYRSGKMWWDDYLVVPAVLADILYWVSLWIIPPPGSITDFIVTPVKYWLVPFPCITAIWLSKICFLFLLVRLFPPRHVYRRITLGLTVIFLFIYFALIVLGAPWCDEGHCKMLGKCSNMIVFFLIAGLLSDLILVIWPLLMLYKIKLSRPKDRPLVMVSLGCSIFTFLLTLVVAIFLYIPTTANINYYIVVGMLDHIIAAVTLIVCNMPVVACTAYRAFQRARGVPLGTTVQMPDASQVPNEAGGSGLESSLPYSSESKETSRGNTRLTYDDLTRISMSFDMHEV